MEIPEKQAKMLTEEERDIQLIFESLSTKENITKDELLRLSFPSYCRFLVYKYAPASISLEDKTYLADTIAANYSKFKKIKHIRKSSAKLDEAKAEQIAQYYLTALCLFANNMKKFVGKYPKDFWINLTNNAFCLAGKRDFAYKLDTYIEIIQKIKMEKWF